MHILVLTVVLTTVAAAQSSLTSKATTTLTSTTTSSTPLANSPIPSRGNCPPSLHAVAISGAGSDDYGGYGGVQTLVRNVTNAIPNSTQVTLTYPKGKENISHGINIGSSNLATYLREYHRACPATKIALLSYSAGAVIAFNNLCGPTRPWDLPNPYLGSNWTSAIVALTAYGDATWRQGQSYNRGSCVGTNETGGDDPRQLPTGCVAWEGRMRSWCNVGDNHCCSGNDEDAHYTYPQMYDMTATNFIVRKYNAASKRRAA